MLKGSNSSNLGLLIKVIATILLIFIPPLVFEKYTYFLFSTTGDSSAFFYYSGKRLDFDIGWFIGSGALSALIVGRKKWLFSLLPGAIGAAAFTISVYFVPFCAQQECYISSTDGLGALRDFLLFASLGMLASGAVISDQVYFASKSRERRLQMIYLFAISILIGYALSFLPLVHIFAEVTVPYPGNYIQWFLASAAPSFAAALVINERSQSADLSTRTVWLFLTGISGVLLGIVIDFSLPCEACSGYAVSIGSLVAASVAFSLIGVFVGRLIASSSQRRSIGRYNKYRSATITLTITVTIILVIVSFFLVTTQVSVVNSMGPNVANASFSPLEIGTSFVYSGGYLATPQYRPTGVGVSVNFGNSSISNYSSNFLAAGFGDQSPNCCKDGLDLAYRADAVLFPNGTETLLARSWWACDDVTACGGFSWQQLLHFGGLILPKGTLSNWVDLQMNWTSPTLVGWYYRVHYSSNGTVTPWIMYNSFTPPTIDNHYFDAGICCGDVLFYQFGISSGHEIESNSWEITFRCPMLIENGSWTCLQHASFINGQKAFWKSRYTWGETYSGLGFNYLGNYTVEFYYSGSSPNDGTTIW